MCTRYLFDMYLTSWLCDQQMSASTHFEWLLPPWSLNSNTSSEWLRHKQWGSQLQTYDSSVKLTLLFSIYFLYIYRSACITVRSTIKMCKFVLYTYRMRIIQHRSQWHNYQYMNVNGGNQTIPYICNLMCCNAEWRLQFWWRATRSTGFIQHLLILQLMCRLFENMIKIWLRGLDSTCTYPCIFP